MTCGRQEQIALIMVREPEHLASDEEKAAASAAEAQVLKRSLERCEQEVLSLEQQLKRNSAYLEHKIQERTRELEAVNRIASTVSHSLNLEVTLKQSLEKVLEVFDLKAGCIMLADRKGAKYSLKVHKNLPEDVVALMSEVPLGKGCAGKIALTGAPVIMEDFTDEEYGAGALADHPEFKSLIGIPLESKGKVRGVLCAVGTAKSSFSSEDIKLLSTIGSEIGIAIENAGLYEKSHAHSRKMELLSITDSLTGLYNRRHFYHNLKREIARARRQHNPLSLLVVDLDNLKSYNDTYGHLQGDEAIRGVGRAINVSIRGDVDTGYRFGGDEFAVILPYIGVNEASAVAERIRTTFEGYAFDSTTLSIGLAELAADESVDDFVGRADTAMYTAKGAGGNQVKVSGF